MFILAASLARLMTSTRSYCLSILPHTTVQYNVNTLPNMIKVERALKIKSPPKIAFENEKIKSR
jgi:hypothetical protein